jgi:hypothetical protein
MRNQNMYSISSHMKTLLDDFNAKVDRQNIFKPTIRNESLYEISNDNGVTVVNFATSKFQMSKVQCSHNTTLINILGLLLTEDMQPG